jgi:glutamate racemase
VIQPAVRKAVGTSRNRKVGVIGTSATVNSKAYEDAFAAAVDFEITSAACPTFVDFVERGVTSGPELLAAAESYLAPIKAAKVDTLVLGCTHYPLLHAALSYVMGDSVNLVSSADETAKDVFRVLTEHDLLAPESAKPSYKFYATGNAKEFESLAKRFLGPEVNDVTHLERKTTNE